MRPVPIRPSSRREGKGRLLHGIQSSHPYPARTRPEGARSVSRGDWGVGSDLDLLIISKETAKEKIARVDTTSLPVPVDLIVYSSSEFEKIQAEERLGPILSEITWIEP